MTPTARIRRHLGLTQAQFASLAGVNQSTVSRWEDEAADIGPALSHLRRICAGTGKSPSEIMEVADA